MLSRLKRKSNRQISLSCSVAFILPQFIPHPNWNNWWNRQNKRGQWLSILTPVGWRIRLVGSCMINLELFSKINKKSGLIWNSIPERGVAPISISASWPPNQIHSLMQQRNLWKDKRQVSPFVLPGAATSLI